LKVDEGRATVHDLWDARTPFNLSKGEQIAPARRDVGIPAWSKYVLGSKHRAKDHVHVHVVDPSNNGVHEDMNQGLLGSPLGFANW